MDSNIPSIYLFLYREMKKKSNGRMFITYGCVKELLNRRLSKIPKSVHYIILNEMEELELIKKIGPKENRIIELTHNDPKNLLLILDEMLKDFKIELTGKNVEKYLNRYNLLPDF
mgnify:CR=1 FL=1